MVDVTTAVRSAGNYLRQVEQVMGSELKNLRLEEVEKEEGTDHWLITLGYDARSALPPTSSLFNAPGDVDWKYERSYKLFRINAETGEVESMKIRKV